LHFEQFGNAYNGFGKLLWWQLTLSEAWKVPGQFNIDNLDFLVSSLVDLIRGWLFPAFSSHSTTFCHVLAAARLLGQVKRLLFCWRVPVSRRERRFVELCRLDAREMRVERGWRSNGASGTPFLRPTTAISENLSFMYVDVEIE
jgi:hypothetical protein